MIYGAHLDLKNVTIYTLIIGTVSLKLFKFGLHLSCNKLDIFLKLRKCLYLLYFMFLSIVYC